MKRKIRENVKENKSRVKYGRKIASKAGFKKKQVGADLYVLSIRQLKKRHIKKERRDTCLIQGLEV